MQYTAEQHITFGNLLAQKGDFYGAISAYRQALLVDPQHCHARLYLGEALYMLGKYWEACVELSQAHKDKLTTQKEQVLLAAALIRLGHPYEALKFLVEVQYSVNLLDFGTKLSLYYFLGEAYQLLGDVVSAYHNYQTVTTLTEYSTWPCFQLALLSKQMGHNEEVLLWLKKSLQCDPGNSVALLKYAQTLNEYGYREQAKNAYDLLYTLEHSHILVYESSYIDSSPTYMGLFLYYRTQG